MRMFNKRGQGSSPRVRGKLSGMDASTLMCRLIPACAGKTWGRNGGAALTEAHPRVCGENEVSG